MMNTYLQCHRWGDKIRELYLKHGNFQGVELEIQKISEQTSSNSVMGGWENEISLKEIHKWDEYFWLH